MKRKPEHGPSLSPPKFRHEEAGGPSEADLADRAERKRQRRERRELETTAPGPPAAEGSKAGEAQGKEDKKDVDKKKKKKKDKKRKRDKEGRREDSTNPTPAPSTTPAPEQGKPPTAAAESSKRRADKDPLASAPQRWNDWQQVSFEGDEAKKSKFLRLLGHGKAGSASPSTITTTTTSTAGTASTVHSAINQRVAKKIEGDMLALYESSRSFANARQNSGKRGGIGSL